jgi:hypothetical protein
MGGPSRINGERYVADMSRLQYDEHRTFDAVWIGLEERKLGKTSKRTQNMTATESQGDSCANN